MTPRVDKHEEGIKELASMLGVTEATVINWELKGMRPIRRDVIEKVNVFICEILDLI